MMSSIIASSFDRVSFSTKCLGPLASAVMNGRLISVSIVVESSILARSAASRKRCSKTEGARNMTHRLIAALENHLKQVPEDARARILLGGEYARLERTDDALRELNLAVTLRANEASILYNAACLYCALHRKAEALDTLHKAWEAGFRDAAWARRDPDLLILHDEPEFSRLYPEPAA